MNMRFDVQGAGGTRNRHTSEYARHPDTIRHATTAASTGQPSFTPNPKPKETSGLRVKAQGQASQPATRVRRYTAITKPSNAFVRKSRGRRLVNAVQLVPELVQHVDARLVL